MYDKWIGIYIKDTLKEDSTLVSLSKKEREILIKNSNLDCVLTGSWPPFSSFENNKLEGISIDYWNLIKKKTLINSECRIEEKFDNILNLIKEGKADLTVGTTITEDRLKYANFSKPYVSYPIAVATTIDKRYISKTASLIGKKKLQLENHIAHIIF